MNEVVLVTGEGEKYKQVMWMSSILFPVETSEEVSKAAWS